MTGPRILLTISRTWTQWSTVRRAMETIIERYPDATLVHGDDPESDRKAAGIWKPLGGVDEPHPADWDLCDPEGDVACRRAHRKPRKNGTTYCPTAGLRRNTAMVESGPDMCLSFIRGRSRGASDCTRKARAAGVPVVPYTHEEEA